MEHTVKLHENKGLFADIIARASEHPTLGGLGIPQRFIEKDYWITNALQHLSRSEYNGVTVFKGGTSLSKAYFIGSRFSEDIDIAIIRLDAMSDAQLKKIIRSTEKEMTRDLKEIEHPQSSKGSRYRKSFYQYPITIGAERIYGLIPGQLLLEINSFANPFPYHRKQISSFIYNYLQMVMGQDLIEEYGLAPFYVNVLDKRTTMAEKIVSLIRFSLTDNHIQELEAKIRHFYDLHYLLQDTECRDYLYSTQFKTDFNNLIYHDKKLFENPVGWRNREISDSPLLNNFDGVWNILRQRYNTELPQLSYSLSIPSSDCIESAMKEINNIVLQISR